VAEWVGESGGSGALGEALVEASEEVLEEVLEVSVEVVRYPSESGRNGSRACNRKSPRQAGSSYLPMPRIAYLSCMEHC